ncbi:MAG: RidA family protein [Deltaproteobacteria bacterium]|nr:RidA family protein [Deltaproteobacteria bacterium]
MADPIRVVQPPEWPRPRGYANGVITAGGGERILYVAGMVGWKTLGDSPEGVFDTDDLGEQFAIALDNVLAVVRAAGGAPSHVARMTVYVTDLEAYRRSTATIGRAWRERLGRHYPAMALVGVAGLLEPGAKVEIEATCVLPAAAGSPP